MINQGFQISVLLAVLVYFILLFYLLQKKSLNLKYTLLWIFSGILMLILALFPGILDWFSTIVGISDPTNALFAVVLFCLIIILVSLTSIVSRQNEQIKRITQTIALLDKRIRESEDNP